MLIEEPGKITDRIEFLGTQENCLYLIKGREAMIIGGGVTATAPSLEKQISAMDFDFKKIKYLVIPHSHFDHCGAAPYLKRKFPHVQIVASAYSKEVLSKDKVVSYIADTNKEVIDVLGLQDEYERLNLQFDGVHVDRVVAENDIIDLGDGIEAHFIETPGHTKCSLSVYIPKLKAIFPSDSAPGPTGVGSELSFPSPQYDFSLYVESLQKLAAYEVEICAFEHHGVFFGDQAKNILRQALKQTEDYKNYVTEQYQQLGDLDKVAQKLAVETMEKTKLEFLSLDVQIMVNKASISKVLRLPAQ